jgi:DNA-binding transcriptional regulator YiaG
MHLGLSVHTDRCITKRNDQHSREFISNMVCLSGMLNGIYELRIKHESNTTGHPTRRHIHMRNKTSDAVAILRRRIDDDPELSALVQEARSHRQIAELIHKLRESEGLSQSELASRIGTSQSTIARLEDQGYSGHTLTMLTRILTALGRDLEIRTPRKPVTS